MPRSNWTTTLPQFLASLPDPNSQGDSAYRTVHEYVHDVATSLDGSADPVLDTRCALLELEQWARELRRRLA